MLSASSNIHQLFLLIDFVWWLKEMAPVCCNTSSNYTALCVQEYTVQVAFREKIWAFCVMWLFAMFIHSNTFTFCTWIALNLKWRIFTPLVAPNSAFYNHVSVGAESWGLLLVSYSPAVNGANLKLIRMAMNIEHKAEERETDRERWIQRGLNIYLHLSSH